MRYQVKPIHKMYSINSTLHTLAMERKNRESRESPAAEEEWNCPVCYTDGSESGHVIPKCCTHKICLDCYSNILTKTANCVCPVCRAEYRQQPNNEETAVVPNNLPPYVPPSGYMYSNDDGRAILREDSIPENILGLLRNPLTRRRRHLYLTEDEPKNLSLIENIVIFFHRLCC